MNYYNNWSTMLFRRPAAESPLQAGLLLQICPVRRPIKNPTTGGAMVRPRMM